MANDRNIRYCQIFGTTSPFFRKKITWLKQREHNLALLLKLLKKL